MVGGAMVLVMVAENFASGHNWPQLATKGHNFGHNGHNGHNWPQLATKNSVRICLRRN